MLHRGFVLLGSPLFTAKLVFLISQAPLIQSQLKAQHLSPKIFHFCLILNRIICEFLSRLLFFSPQERLWNTKSFQHPAKFPPHFHFLSDPHISLHSLAGIKCGLCNSISLWDIILLILWQPSEFLSLCHDSKSRLFRRGSLSSALLLAHKGKTQSRGWGMLEKGGKAECFSVISLC